MPYNLVQAGAAVGKNKSAILRAIRKGVISASRDETTGGWAIEPAELHRVFPAVSGETAAATSNNHDATGELRELRARLDDAQETISDLRRRLDRADEERQRAQSQLAGLLADQRPAKSEPVPDLPPVRRSWLPWRRR